MVQRPLLAGQIVYEPLLHDRHGHWPLLLRDAQLASERCSTHHQHEMGEAPLG